MKLRFLTVLALLAVTRLAAADTHVTMKKHVDGYYKGGIPHAEQNSVYEMWIGAGKLAYITENSAVVIDEQQKTMLITNKSKKTYVQTALPMKWSALVPAPILKFIEGYPMKGTVKSGKGRKKIGKWPCKSYVVDAWIDYQGSRVNETESTLWVTTRVPFNRTKANRMLRTLRKFDNFDDKLIEQYITMKGFPVLIEITHYDHGFSYLETHEAATIAKEKAPPSVYSIPEGYKKNDLLSIEDLRNE